MREYKVMAKDKIQGLTFQFPGITTGITGFSLCAVKVQGAVVLNEVSAGRLPRNFSKTG